MRINGTGPFSCMFDSGGTPLSLDAAVAGKAGLKPNGQGETAAGGPSVQRTSVFSMRRWILGHSALRTARSFFGRWAIPSVFSASAFFCLFVVQVRNRSEHEQRSGDLLNGGSVIPVRLELKPGVTIDAKFLLDTVTGGKVTSRIIFATARK